MKTIIAGSRTAKLSQVIETLGECSWVNDITEVVSGCAKGADSYGELLAKEYGLPVKKFPAKWKNEDDEVDRYAGFKRNIEMANYADSLIAIDCGSKGIKHMIKIATEKNLLIFVKTF